MQSASTPRRAFRIGVVLMGGALLLAGCNVLKLGQSTDDKAITTEIQAKLFDDPVLKMRDIHVNCEHGAVTLTGTVGTELEKAAVERIASQADGVKKVVNQLAVSSAPGTESPAPAQTTPTAGATSPVSPDPASARPERARASGRRH